MLRRPWPSPRLLLLLGCVLAVTLAGCTAVARPAGGGKGGSAVQRLEVVASFYPLAEAARQVGGDRVRVTNLTPAGAEPHDLELNPRQTEQFLTADVVVLLGGGFQPSVEDAARQRQKGTVEVLRALPVSGQGDVAGQRGQPAQRQGIDPHVWLDPTLMRDTVDVVADALAVASPAD